MSKKAMGLAIIAAALLVATVGSVVSARVLRVGMMDYEVYPCTYNANAGYYVPWDGNAAGQFWISAPVWEWGGDGGALCADSDGDWRDNGVREGAPNPEFGEEYRRTQTAFNERRAAFSASLVSLSAQIQEREERAQEIRDALIEAGQDEEEVTELTDAELLALEGLYSAALTSCDDTHDAALAAAGDNDRAAIDAADEARGECFHTAVRDYAETARRVYSRLQTSCRANNPPNPAHPDGPDAQYQRCVSAGQLGSQGADTGTIVLPVFNPETGMSTDQRVPIAFKECTLREAPDGGVNCAKRNVRDSNGNLVYDNRGRVVQEYVTDGKTYYPPRVTYTGRIPNPEITLNPETPTTPTAVPTPEPTAQYYVLRDEVGNIVATYNQAYFSGTECAPLYDYVDEYDERDEDANIQEWANSHALAVQFDADNGCGEYN